MTLKINNTIDKPTFNTETLALEFPPNWKPRTVSQETRQKISQSLKGQKKPRYKDKQEYLNNPEYLNNYVIKEASEIGRKGRGKWIYVPCIICKEYRWIDLVDYRRILNKSPGRSGGRCRKCQQKDAAKAMQAKNYKGGTTTNEGYVYITIQKDSPYSSMRSKNCSYVKRCRIILAEHLGRCLTSKEEVHHINGDKSDDRLENLFLKSKHDHKKNYATAYKEGYNRAITDIKEGKVRI